MFMVEFPRRVKGNRAKHHFGKIPCCGSQDVEGKNGGGIIEKNSFHIYLTNFCVCIASCFDSNVMKPKLNKKNI